MARQSWTCVLGEMLAVLSIERGAYFLDLSSVNASARMVLSLSGETGLVR